MLKPSHLLYKRTVHLLVSFLLTQGVANAQLRSEDLKGFADHLVKIAHPKGDVRVTSWDASEGTGNIDASTSLGERIHVTNNAESWLYEIQATPGAGTGQAFYSTYDEVRARILQAIRALNVGGQFALTKHGFQIVLMQPEPEKLPDGKLSTTVVEARIGDVVNGVSTLYGNSITAQIDLETGQIVSLSGVSGYDYEPLEPTISEQEAKSIAVKQFGELKKIKAQLSYGAVGAASATEAGKKYVGSRKLPPVWWVLGSGKQIEIHARTGEVLDVIDLSVASSASQSSVSQSSKSATPREPAGSEGQEVNASKQSEPSAEKAQPKGTSAPLGGPPGWIPTVVVLLLSGLGLGFILRRAK
jgi:hypothetical protein